MIQINKDTARFIRDKLPDAQIYKTMKTHSGRGNYWIEETSAVLKTLAQYKNRERVVEEYPACK